jgi:ABC-type sugar transport system ATPase subunit
VGAKAGDLQHDGGVDPVGIAIIMISSEMPELIGMSDRILVMAGGRITGEFTDVSKASQEDILKLALGELEMIQPKRSKKRAQFKGLYTLLGLVVFSS